MDTATSNQAFATEDIGKEFDVMRTRAKELQKIVESYRTAGNTWPASMRTVADWAIAQDRWKPHPQAPSRQCARELAKAMREEYLTDENGRRVRTKHAVSTETDGTQTTLWGDIRTAPPSYMAVAFQQRRERIVGDCRQLKTDVDYFNLGKQASEQLELVFDFRRDLAELEALEKTTSQKRRRWSSPSESERKNSQPRSIPLGFAPLQSPSPH